MATAEVERAAAVEINTPVSTYLQTAKLNLHI